MFQQTHRARETERESEGERESTACCDLPPLQPLSHDVTVAVGRAEFNANFLASFRTSCVYVCACVLCYECEFELANSEF